MLKLKKRYIVNEKNEPVEVVLDLASFKKIEELLEDQLFGKILKKAAKEKPLSFEEFKRRYARRKKRA